MGLFQDELAVGQRWRDHRDGAEPLERKGHRLRAPPVVAEHELVEIRREGARAALLLDESRAATV